MKRKELLKQYKSLETEQEKDKLAGDFAEQKIIGCGRVLFMILVSLVILCVIFGLIAALKRIIIALFI